VIASGDGGGGLVVQILMVNASPKPQIMIAHRCNTVKITIKNDFFTNGLISNSPFSVEGGYAYLQTGPKTHARLGGIDPKVAHWHSKEQ
jgi:aspartate oxidase